MTVPRLLVVGAETWDDGNDTIGTALERAHQRLFEEFGIPPILASMGREGAESIAEAWWRGRGHLVESRKPFKHKYIYINSLLDAYPELVLIFGKDGATKRAIEGAERALLPVVQIRQPSRRGQIRVVQIAENEDAE